jgi:hypothetical protein
VSGDVISEPPQKLSSYSQTLVNPCGRGPVVGDRSGLAGWRARSQPHSSLIRIQTPQG